LITQTWVNGVLNIIGQQSDAGILVQHFFQPGFAWDYPVAGQQSVIADLNGDGLDDLVLAATDQYTEPLVTVMLNDGTGNLGGQQNYLIGDSGMPEGVAAAAMFGRTYASGAPMLDLVTFDSLAHQVVILENDGSGHFTQAGASPTLTVNGVISVAAGDFNGDGWGDAAILIADTTPYSIQILLGNGSGLLTPGPVFGTSLKGTVGGMNMFGGPFGLNGGDAFVAITDESTVSVFRDVCR
jgi:hypothetical protein